MITDRAFKSTQTRCDNKYQDLKEEIEPLYKKREGLLNDFRFFCTAREHEKLPQLNVKHLNEVRENIMQEIASINIEVKRITDLMLENHKKKVDSVIEWQQEQKVINGFKIQK